MSMSKDYRDFIGKLDRFRPRIENKLSSRNQLSLPLDYERDKDDGNGL
jgi:hypothetical protein